MRTEFDETHQALEGFSDFYDREIRSWLAEREAARQAARKKAIILVGVSCPIGAVLLLSGLSQHPLLGPTGGPDMMIGVGVILLGAFFANKALQSLRGDVKHFLMAKICGFLGLSYRAAAEWDPLEIFRLMQIVPNYSNAFLEDEIRGEYRGVSLHVVEARLLERRPGTYRRATYVQVFRGLVMGFSFPHAFVGRTVITWDKGWLGNFLDRRAAPWQRVGLDDARFEEAFEVYGTEPVHSRMLMTADFKEGALALVETLGKRSLQFAFTDDVLLVALRQDRDLFEARKMSRPLEDPAYVQGLLNDLGLIYLIVDTLRLSAE